VEEGQNNRRIARLQLLNRISDFNTRVADGLKHKKGILIEKAAGTWLSIVLKRKKRGGIYLIYSAWRGVSRLAATGRV
jgi:hypothetical protein